MGTSIIPYINELLLLGYVYLYTSGTYISTFLVYLCIYAFTYYLCTGS